MNAGTGGSRTLTGNLSNQGTLTIGASSTIAALTVTGSYTQTPAGTLNMELSGATCGSFDTMSISGSATLAGTLNIGTINGCVPAGSGETRQIITFGSRTGDFGTVNGLSATLTYTGAGTTSVTLTI